jgi:predicted nucleotide-binding protein
LLSTQIRPPCASIQSKGRSLAQKLSDEAQNVDLIFILLSAENDTFASADHGGGLESRADVVFELGYFLGSSRRRLGKVVVLTEGTAAPSSAVEGVVVLDASAGLRTIEERLRLALAEWIG